MKYCPLCENDYPDDVTVCPLDGGTVRRPGTRADPFIGRVIRARYRVERKLGEGGMGAVYLAEQLSIGRKVALKVLRGDFARDDSFVARFRQEAKLVAVLNDTHNPHVTLVHDFDQAEDGSVFIVMEWLEGRGLNEVIQREGALALPRAIRLATQIAQGLEAAHRAGVIHRDIKPHNIMVLDANDNIKLMDFGIARLRDSSQTPLTRVGTMMGTPDYMAPEQIEGQEVTDKTDIYSFGIVVYEMLTGVVPFRANTPAAVLTKQLREEPTPPTRLRPEIPADLEELVLRALAKDPAARPRDMGEIAAGLTAMSRTSTGAVARPTVPPARTLIQVDAPPPAAATVALPPPMPVETPAPSSSETWFSEAPGSQATVIVDRVDDAGRRTPPREAVRAPSRRALVMAGGVAALLVVGTLTAWLSMDRRSSKPERPPSAPAVAPIVTGPSSTGSVSPPPVVEAPVVPRPGPAVGVSEVTPRPEPPPEVKPPRSEPTPPVEPRPAAVPRPKPPRPVEAHTRPEAKSPPSSPAVKPAPPSAELLRSQVEDRLRGKGLLRGSGPDPDTGVIVEVNPERIVVLRGIVRDAEQRDEAIRLARVAGVAEVRPRINVQRSWN